MCSVLIMGLTSDQLRERLLENEELSLTKAVRICLAVEESKKQVQEMSEAKEVCTVRTNNHKVNSDVSKCPSVSTQFSLNSQPSTSSGVRGQNQNFRSNTSSKGWLGRPSGSFQQASQMINCYRCGMTHQIRKCPAFGKQCSACGIFNHFQKMCRKKNVHTVLFDNNDSEMYNVTQEFDDENNVFIGMVNDNYFSRNSKEWKIEMLVHK